MPDCIDNGNSDIYITIRIIQYELGNFVIVKKKK